MTANQNSGIQSIRSKHSFDSTVERLRHALEAKGVTIFSIVDHRAEAQKAGLKMPPTKVFAFGNPRGGTPVMLAAPSAAIDLPLKILVAEDGEGAAWVSYNSLTYLQERHGIPQDVLQNLAVVETLAASTAE